MVYPKTPPAAAAVDKDKVLALHDYEGICGLCKENCDSTQDELNALCCTFEPCPSPSIYHQSCLEAYLKSIRLDKQRKTGFACPRNCGKAAKGDKACPGRISKSHPIYARNDNSKKRRKAKMPEPVVVPPPAPAGKKPPLPKTSPKVADEKPGCEERSRVVALVKSERPSKPVPIVVANTAKQAAAAAQEEARQEIQMLRARKESARNEGPAKREVEGEEDEYAAPRVPASLADFTVSLTKAKGRGASKAGASSTQAQDEKSGKGQVSAAESPSEASPPLPSSEGAPNTPATAPVGEKDNVAGGESSLKSQPSTGLLQEEPAKIRSPSKSQRKHQQRLAARHSRERPDAAPVSPRGMPTLPGAAATAGMPSLTEVHSASLHQPLETVQETSAFPPLPGSKKAVSPPPAPALPALRCVVTPPRDSSLLPECALSLVPASPVPVAQSAAKDDSQPWSVACKEALQERKIAVHAAQLQGLGYFSEAQCVAAVRACGADLGLCCDWLLSGGTKVPTSSPPLDISADLARLSDLVAAGSLSQAALDAAVVQCQGDIDAALRPASATPPSLPPPPMSIVTTPALAAIQPPPAVSPGGGSDFGAISRPSSSSSNRSAGSPWSALDSKGSCSEASSFFSTGSAWGSLGASLVTSPPAAPSDGGSCFSPFGGGFVSELLRTNSVRAEGTTPRGKPAWSEGVDANGGSDSFSSRDGSLLSRSADAFGGSFGLRSVSSVDGSLFSDGPEDSAESQISEAQQCTVTSVAAAVLQDSFDDPMPPPPSYTSPHASWGGQYQDAQHPHQRMFQPLAPGHHFGGAKHVAATGRNGVSLRAFGASDPPPAIWGFNTPSHQHNAFNEHAFYEGAARAHPYGREQTRGGPFAEGPHYGGTGRQPGGGMVWRDGRGGGFGPEAGQHPWADQDRLVTQLLSTLLV